MCTVLLPPGGNPISVNKYIISKFTLEQDIKVQKGSKRIALLFFNLGARLGWVVNAKPPPMYSEKETG
jgi:hypothetical protein